MNSQNKTIFNQNNSNVSQTPFVNSGSGMTNLYSGNQGSNFNQVSTYGSQVSKFNFIPGEEIDNKGKKSNVNYYTITYDGSFSSFSLEELRKLDYENKKKGVVFQGQVQGSFNQNTINNNQIGNNMFGGVNAPSSSTGGIFGQQSTTGGMFSQPQQSTTRGGMFNQPVTSTTGGMFGQPVKSTTGGMFGQPQLS